MARHNFEKEYGRAVDWPVAAIAYELTDGKTRQIPLEDLERKVAKRIDLFVMQGDDRNSLEWAGRVINWRKQLDVWYHKGNPWPAHKCEYGSAPGHAMVACRICGEEKDVS